MKFVKEQYDKIKILPYFIGAFIFLFIGCTNDITFEKTKTLSYPSGSGLTYCNNKIYLIGDDATSVLITDTAFTIIDSIKIFDSLQQKIPKTVKPDLEAATVVSVNKSREILLVGSGSLTPYRNKCWLINPDTKQKRKIDLTEFYKRIKKEGIEILNIEGVTATPGGIILASRGNKTSTANYLIFTANNFWDKQTTAPIKIIKAGANYDTAFFSGVSGLEYSLMSDNLLLTISTENTYNTFDDGAIGKNYLWVIKNISNKENAAAINPNKIIDLDLLDKRFQGHKIESVSILQETKKTMQLALVADDDNGTSVLFKITIKK